MSHRSYRHVEPRRCCKLCDANVYLERDGSWYCGICAENRHKWSTYPDPSGPLPDQENFLTLAED